MANELLDELKEYLKLKTYQELAGYWGVKVSTVYSWSKYGKITDTGVVLVKNPEINGEYLKERKGSLLIKEREPTNIQPIGAPERGSRIANIIKIPVLGKVPAGMPGFSEEFTNDYISVPDAPPNCFALKVHGESMEPTFKHNDYVLFVIDQDIKHGDIVIVNDEFGESMVKRYKEKEGEQLLTSDNPSYPTYKPNGEYRVMGKVVGAWRQLNI